jgi:hypothetical protein
VTELEKAVAEIESFISIGRPCMFGEEGEWSDEFDPENHKILTFGVPVHPGGNKDATPPDVVVRHALVNAVRSYAEDIRIANELSDYSTLTLWWRIPPETELRDDYILMERPRDDWTVSNKVPTPFLRFYTRFVISTKPVRFKSTD